MPRAIGARTQGLPACRQTVHAVWWASGPAVGTSIADCPASWVTSHLSDRVPHDRPCARETVMFLSENHAYLSRTAITRVTHSSCSASMVRRLD